jgi:phenylacetate-coenzyme A ligase PaaK-like adenylate-forming protein
MADSFFQREIETADRNKIKGIQAVALANMLNYIEMRSGFYQEKFKRANVALD